jgi:hypothetical protein
MRTLTLPRRSFATVLLVAALVLMAVAFAPIPSSSQTEDQVINQIYAGGQSSTAPRRTDFIELFNQGTAAVPVDDWTIQYSSARGTAWHEGQLAGAIPPSGFYLVHGVPGDDGADLPAPDAQGSLLLSMNSGRLALVRSAEPLMCGADPACATSPDVVDFVGCGPEAVSFEGSGTAPSPRREGALFRANGGCSDGDGNAVDFALPDPQTSATTADPSLLTPAIGDGWGVRALVPLAGF